MKKVNLVFGCVVLMLAVGLFVLSKPTDTAGEKWAEVMVDGQIIGRYSLLKDHELNIKDKNRLIIKNGIADMTDAHCPDKICVHQGAISKVGETIVCLPNRVIVTIVGEEDKKLDIIAQ